MNGNMTDLRMEMPDTNDGKALSKFCRKLAVPLRQGLRKAKYLNNKKADFKQMKKVLVLHALFLVWARSYFRLFIAR